MSDLTTVPAEEHLPSVEDIARRIAAGDEPDATTLQIARAVRSRLVATDRKAAGRSCVSCRHRTSPGVGTAYIGVCVNPIVAEISYRADSDETVITGVECGEERGARTGHRRRVPVCGPSGALHEPMAAPGILPHLRAHLRWRRLGNDIRH